MEKWVDIEGFEGLYQISTFGNISRVKKDNKILKQCISGKNKKGYFRVGLCKNGITAQKSVHRLLAQHFIPNNSNKPQVNHIDGNKLNNKLNNLEWVTAKENSSHAYSTGLSKPTNLGFGKDSHRHKRVKQRDGDGKTKVWDSMMSAGRAGYDTSCICRCCKGQSKTHKGSSWEYTEDKITESTFPEKVEIKKISKICPTCGITFYTHNGKKTYCSRKCGKKAWDKNYNNKIKRNKK